MSIAFVSIAALAATARADAGSTSEPPAPPTQREPTLPPAPTPAPRDHTAAEVAGAPLPGGESGRTDEPEGDSAARRVARAVLFVPKLGFEIALSPVRGYLWADDRYHFQDVYYRVFYNDARTIGLYPTATYESGFGASAGAGFVDEDLFGASERLGLQATTGAVTGELYRASASASLRSGDRLGDHVALELDANFDRRPSDPFYGIGNGDVSATPAMPIDPRTDDTAVSTTHRYQEARVAASATVRPSDAISIVADGALTDLSFAPSTSGPAIDQVFDPMGMVGFTTGVRHLYGGLELRWDTRGRATKWEPGVRRSTGSLAAIYAGRVAQLDGAPDFWRYGAELQHAVYLARGPRFIALRLRGDGVTGSRDVVPFTELPYLGGGTFLRGYSFERFRDRVALLGTIQYEWDLARNADAYVFVDAGRVYDSLDALGFTRMRVGYGVGVTLHQDHAGFLVEAAIASSIDGGLFVSASFNPGFDSRPRWR